MYTIVYTPYGPYAQPVRGGVHGCVRVYTARTRTRLHSRVRGRACVHGHVRTGCIRHVRGGVPGRVHVYTARTRRCKYGRILGRIRAVFTAVHGHVHGRVHGRVRAVYT